MAKKILIALLIVIAVALLVVMLANDGQQRTIAHDQTATAIWGETFLPWQATMIYCATTQECIAPTWDWSK